MPRKIEKNVAMPVSLSGEIRETLEKMNVGDSFAYPNEERGVALIITSGKHSATGTGKRWTHRQVDGMWRCWRVR